MKHIKTYIAAACAVMATVPGYANEPDSVAWTVLAEGHISSGRVAPYLLGAANGGRYSMRSGAQLEAAVEKPLNMSRRFSWTAGADVIAGYQKGAAYGLYNPETSTWTSRTWSPAGARVMQLWGGVKYRGVLLWGGMRDRLSDIVDNALSSGDVVLSDNARAIPRMEIGFVDFQNIPFTHGWAQIYGTISYGKYADSRALEGRYNYYTSHITTGQLFTYKRVYFRSRTDRPLTVTVGMQAAGEFGGTTSAYSRGKLYSVTHNGHNLRAYWEMFLPGFGSRHSDGFMEGNHVGSWDFKGRYRLHNGMDLEGYFQWLWEDGSGMAKRNCTDGLWGVAVRMPGRYPAVKAVVAEYIDFRDQSGPVHWAPTDAPGTTIVTEATGADNVYNSTTFNAWANYGLGLGSTFPVPPLWNADGNPQFLHCRTRGMHVAATGYITPAVQWTAKFSHAVGWGTGRIPDADAAKNTSALVTATWDARAVAPGWAVAGKVAFDAGSLRGNNWGGMLSVTYSGSLAY